MKEVDNPSVSLSEEIAEYLGLDNSDDKGTDGGDEKEDGNVGKGLKKLIVRRKKFIDAVLYKIPVIRKLVSKIYLVSKKNIQRDVHAVVLNDNVTFDKFCGVWVDVSVDTVTDVYNMHGLDLLRQNMEKNDEFAERMIALDPSTQREKVMVREDYKQKSKMIEGKKQSNHG